MVADAPRPRLCHLRKSPDFAGYGFNLHAEKGKAGQFIGNVDPGSPAETAGLRQNDRIVEVNGTNVHNENHAQVVERIKAVSDQVVFLVVDPETDAYFIERGIIITGAMDDIEKIGGAAEDDEPVLPTASSEAERTEEDSETERDREPTDDNADDSTTREETALTRSNSSRSLRDEDGQSDTGPAAAVPVAAFAVTEEEQPAHCARICTLKTWPDFGGYGFNLHANKGEPKQYIGKVDDDSPADLSGLKEGDRIVAVNGVNVDNATHPEVVQLIKSTPGTVSLLVVDDAADDYFKERDIIITEHMSSVERITCPDSNPKSVITTAERADVPPPSYSEAAELRQALAHPHRARLCVIHSWKDGKGYGFSMQASKSDAKAGQFIGKVDDGSPASNAGLRQGDRIIEVNGENVETSSHKEVVTKIKSVPDTVTLLVVDEDTEKYFKDKDIKVASTMDDCVKRITGSATKPTDAVVKTTTTVTTKTEVTTNGSVSPPVVVGGIEFAPTAQEARRRMSKKKSISEDKRSMRAKYELFQQL